MRIDSALYNILLKGGLEEFGWSSYQALAGYFPFKTITVIRRFFGELGVLQSLLLKGKAKINT